MSAAGDGAAWPAKIVIDGHRRTLQPIRRDSHPADAGDAFFRPVTKELVVRIQRAAERLVKISMRARGKGRRWGELTPIDVQVLEAMLFRFMTWSTGKLDCSYDQLQEATGRARDTIARALERLAAVGILKKLRRFVRTEIEGKGPQVHQVTNAYAVELPRRLAALIGLGAEPPPPPDDAIVARTQARLDNDVAETAWTGQPTLGDSLARLEHGVRQRESRN